MAPFLEDELKTFQEKKDSLVAKSEGQYVLIRGDEIAGAYDSELGAISEGYKRYGNVPFLVKLVSPVESPANFVSNNLGI